MQASHLARIRARERTHQRGLYLVNGTATRACVAPPYRYRFAYAVLDNFIYVMGGTDSASSDAGPLDTVMVYNISGDSWSFGDKLSRPRIDPCGAAVAGKVRPGAVGRWGPGRRGGCAAGRSGVLGGLDAASGSCMGRAQCGHGPQLCFLADPHLATQAS